MAGTGELTPKQERAVCALLRHGSIRKAAPAVPVNEKTLRLWLKQPAFVTAYREARRQAVEAALGLLQRDAVRAARALRRNLRCGKPGDEIRAALGILGTAVKAVELLDMEERLAALEERLAGHARNGRPL
jgi:hypothetical protein